MRLATIAMPAGGTAAAVVDPSGGLVPVAGAGDVGALLADPAWRARAESALADGTALAPGGVRLLRPVLRPAATICVGANYRAHIAEMGREPPEAPALFDKLAQALADPGDVVLPRPSAAVDYEGELVVVIGTAARDVPVERALDHVAGYTLMNDVSARDYQFRSLQWFAGKNFEASTPVGPWLVTPDEVGDLATRTLVTRVNGEERQRSSLGDLCFDVPTLIADISRILTLQPGDLIATGTPGGVGFAREPKLLLSVGDRVDVEVDGIGVLGSRFV